MDSGVATQYIIAACPCNMICVGKTCIERTIIFTFVFSAFDLIHYVMLEVDLNMVSFIFLMVFALIIC